MSANPIVRFEISTTDGAIYDDGERLNIISVARNIGVVQPGARRACRSYFSPTRSSLRRVARAIEHQIFGPTIEEKRQAKTEAARISQLELTVIQLKARLYDLIASK